MKNLFQPIWTSLAIVVGLITSIWSVSAIGYYQIAEALKLEDGYNDGPGVFSLYYGTCCLVAVFVFHPALST